VVKPNSKKIYPNATIETGFEEIGRRAPWPNLEGEKEQKEAGEEARPETARFQGMRVAYLCVEKETEGETLGLNRIVSLKQDPKMG
jgi:glutaminyl-tRNA synthetase